MTSNTSARAIARLSRTHPAGELNDGVEPEFSREPFVLLHAGTNEFHDKPSG